MTSGAERGFVLISAMWLLLLGGSLAALLTLRAATPGRGLAFDDRRHAAAALADDAVETIAADLVFRGAASPWGRPPYAGTMTIEGVTVPVAVEAEDALPDINHAPPVRLEVALARIGLDADARTAVLARIAAGRGRPVTALADIAALGRGVVPPGLEPCLAAVLSPFQAAGGGGAGSGLAVGSLLRATVGTGPARQLFVLRLVATGERPYALLDAYAAACPVAVALPTPAAARAA